MANYIDNKAGSSQTVCDWLTKYNALCDELQADITAIEGVNTAQQAQIDNLIANGAGGDFVPLAGAQVEENFFVAVEDARIQLSGNGVELIMPSQGYVKLGPDGFTTDATTKAGYLNDTPLRPYSAMTDKEWVSKGQLQKVITGVDLGTETTLPYARHLFFNVENFDILAGPNIISFLLDPTTNYVDGDKVTLMVPDTLGYPLQIFSQQSGGRTATDIVGATNTNVNGAWIFEDAPQPIGTYCSKYEIVYSNMFGFLIDVKHYV